jgi:hypothetical protein
MTADRARLAGLGFREAVLWVLDGNSRAEAFYRADGWTRDEAERDEVLGPDWWSSAATARAGTTVWPQIQRTVTAAASEPATTPEPSTSRATVDGVSLSRYRCDACGNLTRFDVTVSQTTKAFHHFTVGGELVIEDEELLSRHVDDVVCRWCGHGRSVVEITDDEAEEPGAPSKAS